MYIANKALDSNYLIEFNPKVFAYLCHQLGDS